MSLAWIISAGLILALIPNLSFLEALVISACITSVHLPPFLLCNETDDERVIDRRIRCWQLLLCEGGIIVLFITFGSTFAHVRALFLLILEGTIQSIKRRTRAYSELTSEIYEQGISIPVSKFGPKVLTHTKSTFDRTTESTNRAFRRLRGKKVAISEISRPILPDGLDFSTLGLKSPKSDGGAVDEERGKAEGGMG